MTPDDLLAARLEPVGHLTDASNAAVLVRCHPESGDAFFALYKPVEGERPLWDFPDGCLAHREVAAYLLSEAAGWQVVPPTVMRDGPWGPGVAAGVGHPGADEGTIQPGDPDPGRLRTVGA